MANVRNIFIVLKRFIMKEFDKNQFAYVVKSEREKRSLSLRDVAAKSGVSAATISRIEKGSLPDMGSFVALVQWLELDGAKVKYFLK